jgi:hypothetical protein
LIEWEKEKITAFAIFDSYYLLGNEKGILKIYNLEF